MKKYLIPGLMAAVATMTACSDNDDPKPVIDPVYYPSGVYVICQGNYYHNIEGALSVIDPVIEEVFPDVFKSVNGRNIGATPQCGVAYGSHIYIGTYESNTIEVLDRTTYKAVKQISLAGSEGQNPRDVVAYEGKLYFTMADGYVSRIDTLSLAVDASVKVGNFPETPVVWKGSLYVPNSDGLSTTGFGRTASRIDLASFTVAETLAVPQNPVQFAVVDDNLYLRCSGNYYDELGAIYRVKGDGTYEKLVEATCMAVNGKNIYYINLVYGNPVVTYGVYNTATGSTSPMIAEGSDPEYPAAIGVNPRDGHIFITSSVPGPWGFADYDANGYVCEYDPSGKRIIRYEVGVYPSYVFFN